MPFANALPVGQIPKLNNGSMGFSLRKIVAIDLTSHKNVAKFAFFAKFHMKFLDRRNRNLFMSYKRVLIAYSQFLSILF